jgi:hypothetical protein
MPAVPNSLLLSFFLLCIKYIKTGGGERDLIVAEELL